MASKRKASTPCMIPLKTMTLARGVDAADELKEKSHTEEPPNLLPVSTLINSNSEIQTNGHKNLTGERLFCKYCNFGCHETSRFVEHMDTKHLDFKKDPSYVCIACSFLVKDPKELESHNAECHAGDTGLTWSVARHESYSVVEQSVSKCKTSYGIDEFSEIMIPKTPFMKVIKNKPETKKIHTIKDTSKPTEHKRNHYGFNNGSATVSRAVTNMMNPSIVNGSIIGTVPVLQTGMTQLVSLNPPQSMIQPKLSTFITPVLPKPSVLQKPHHLQQNQQLPTAKSLPKVMIPLSSIPTYNAAMDSDSFLKNSFCKFPYPTKAELCYLTVVTKYPEEQIKIWFTAQRLKQGISWSPEEIEDSRKKMFNTVIQSIPQPMPQPTITVLNAPLVANASNVQHLLQAALPGQIVGQPQGAGGLLVTQPIITNGIPGTSTSMALTVTSIPSHQTTQAKIASPAGKVVNTPQPLTTTPAGKVVNTPSPSTITPTTPSDSLFDNSFSRSKKSRQQLNALKNSFHKSQFPTQSEVTKLTKLTGLSTRDVRKWFSDKRYHWRTKGGYIAENKESCDAQSEVAFTMLKEENTCTVPTSVHTPRRQSWHQTPDFTPTKYKERAPEQIKALENSFSENHCPSEEEVNRLRSETKMTRREIDTWFSEKRKKLVEEEKKDMTVKQERDDEEFGNIDVKVEAESSASSTVENNSPVSTERKVNPIKINLKDLRVTESSENTETPEDYVNSLTDGDSRPSSSPKNRQYWRKTAQQREILKQTFVETQWPSIQEYDCLVEKTGLLRIDIVRWFGDCRYCFKNGHLKWYDHYKKSAGDNKSNSVQPLIDYHKQHHLLDDHDIESLCEKTAMSADAVKAWFAEKLEEKSSVVSETNREEVHSDGGEKCVDQKAAPDGVSVAPDGVSVASESNECLEPGTQETCSDSAQISKQTDTQLETD